MPTEPFEDQAFQPDDAPARTAVILAGGRSRRMGTPKAMVEVAGMALIEHPIAAAREAGLQPVVVAKPGSELPDLDCPRLDEPEEPRHPLAGIVRALESLRAPIVVVACDLPLLPAPLIAELASMRTAFAIPANPRPQPLAARYSPGLLPALRQGMVTDSPMVRVTSELGGEVLGESALRAFGDPAWMFANANDPVELALIERQLLA